MDLDVLTTMVDELTRSDPSDWVDGESIEGLHRQLTRFEAFVTEATAAFDATGNWAPDGAKTAAAWLAARCRLPKPTARRFVRRGRALRHLPQCGRAWADGDINSSQVDAIAALESATTHETLERDEGLLVDQARTLRYESFLRAVNYWKQFADPDGIEEDEARRIARRDVYLDSSFAGMWLGKMTLDPISGAIVGGELERLEQIFFEADWSAARESLGREPTAADLDRSPGQRRADALVEMATRSKIAPGDGRRPAPLFTVLVDYQTLHGRVCELAHGTTLTPGSLLPWLDQAYLERAVFAPGRRVEISPTVRLFTGSTRRAIELRDRECTHPYCDVPAAGCEVDHIVPYSAGGVTSQENGRLLCRFHNLQRIHDRRDGQVRWTRRSSDYAGESESNVTERESSVRSQHARGNGIDARHRRISEVALE